MRSRLLAVPIGLLMVLTACVTGRGSFQCTVDLPVWPTTSGPPVTCNGKALGAITGSFDPPGGLYTLAAIDAPFRMDFALYSETCTLGQPLNGFGAGIYTISGLVGTGGGATATGSFVYTRDGAVLVILLPEGAKIFFNDGRRATQIANAAAYAILRPVSPVTGRTCQSPGPLTLQIVGYAEWHL